MPGHYLPVESAFAQATASGSGPAITSTDFGDRGVISERMNPQRAGSPHPAFKTSIRAGIGESTAYNQALRRGEIGLSRPLYANRGGAAHGPDFITAARNAESEMFILVNDAKTSSAGKFPTPAAELKDTWRGAVGKAVSNVSLEGNLALEQEIRTAYAEGRVVLRQLNVDYSPSATAASATGEVPISGWGEYGPAHQNVLPSRGAAGASLQQTRGIGSAARGLVTTSGRGSTAVRKGAALPRWASAAGRGGLVVIRGGVNVAGRVSLALARSLVLFIQFFVLDIALSIMMVVILVDEFHKRRRLEKAIERALSNYLEKGVANLLRKKESALIDYFLRRWGNPAHLFLYVSPLMFIEERSEQSGGEAEFAISFEENRGKLENYLVSRKPLKPRYEERPGAVRISAELRWSVPFPLYTPFDAMAAYLEMVANFIVEDWNRHVPSRKDAKSLNRHYADVLVLLADLAALLHLDYFAGFSSGELVFSGGDARAERYTIISKAKVLVDQNLGPKLRGLEQMGLLDPEQLTIAQLSNLSEKLTHRLTAGFEMSRHVDWLVDSLQTLPDHKLTYQRRQIRSRNDLLGIRRRYRHAYFMNLAQPVWSLVPEDYRQRVTPFFLMQPNPGSQLQLEVIDPLE